MSRVLLIEFIATDRFHRSIPFPFIRGYLQAHDTACLWLRFGHPASWRSGDAADGHGLPAAEAAQLVERCGSFAPTHVVWSTAPTPELAAQVADATGKARAAVLDGDPAPCAAAGAEVLGTLAAFLDRAADPASHPWSLAEHVTPDFAFEAVGDGARTAPALPFLVFGEECNYDKALADNPYFADVDVSGYRGGCSFCTRPAGHGAWQTAPLVLARRQFEALARTLPPVAGRLAVRTVGSLPVRHIEAIAELLLELQRAPAGPLAQPQLPPTDLLLDARADVLAHSRQRLDRALTTLTPTPHKIHVSLIGIESFVDHELERLHKGTTWRENLAAAATLLELEHAHPRSFAFREHGGLSLLLFTPWTRLEDLAANLAVLSRGKLGEACGKRFTSRLRLYPSLPLHALAQRDGLLCDHYDDPWLNTARRNFYADESPWRFADPRIEPLSQLLLRLEPEHPEADALLQALAEADVRHGVTRDREKLAEVLVDVALAHQEPLPPLDLLAAAAQRLSAQAKPRSMDHVAGDNRVVVLPLPLAELDLGLRKVLRIEASHAPSHKVQPLGADPERMVWRPRDTGAGREWFGGFDLQEVEQAIAWTQQLERARIEEEQHELIVKCGKLLGYPECCTEAFAVRPARWLDTYTYVHLFNRLATPGPVPWEVNAAAHGFVDYVPCTLDCAATIARCGRIREAFQRGGADYLPDLERAMRHPWLLALDQEADALELVTEWDGEGNVIRFAPGICYGNGALLASAAQGDEIRFDDQQLVVLRQGRVHASLTARAFIWWHKAALQVPFWQALLRVRFAHSHDADKRLAPPEPSAVGQSVGEEALHANEGIDPRLRAWAVLLQERAPTAGFRVTSVEESHHGRMLLALQLGDGTRLQLLLAERSTTPHAYATAGPFALIHPADVKIDTKPKERVVRLIAASLERFLVRSLQV